MGSFAGAQVWRLRANQLVDDERRLVFLSKAKRLRKGEQEEKELLLEAKTSRTRELKKLRTMTTVPIQQDRSKCLGCGHQLAWYDLIPVVSWLMLGGKCRYCDEPIGRQELFIELGLGLVFGLSLSFWPRPLDSFIEYIIFFIWLVACVVMTVLFVYDLRWYLLPLSYNLLLIGAGIIYIILIGLSDGFGADRLISTAVGVLILGGLYYLFSLFNWTGLGDAILGVGLALFLASWELSLLTLFLANLIGSLALIPIAMRGGIHRSMRIPFGPFLILGTLICILWGNYLVRMYFETIGNSSFALML